MASKPYLPIDVWIDQHFPKLRKEWDIHLLRAGGVKDKQLRYSTIRCLAISLREAVEANEVTTPNKE